jgi:hypothetical protein
MDGLWIHILSAKQIEPLEVDSTYHDIYRLFKSVNSERFHFEDLTYLNFGKSVQTRVFFVGSLRKQIILTILFSFR